MTLKTLLHIRYKLHVQLYPELERFQSITDGARALKTIGKKLFFSARYLCITCFLAALVGIPYIHFSTSITSRSSWIYICCTIALGGLGIPLATMIVPLLLFRQRTRRNLRQELHKRGVPICLHCGYNLTGCQSAQCPECGTVIPRPPEK